MKAIMLIVTAVVLSVLASVAAVTAATTGAEAADTTQLCVFAPDDVYAQSTVGQQANQRIQQLAQQARAEIASSNKQLTADIKAFNGKASQLPEQERQQAGAKLQQRQQQLQQQAKTIEARLRYTRDAVTESIGKQIGAVLDAVYTEHACSIVLNRDSIVRAGDSDDLTAAVIKGLNEKATSIKFDLLQLPQQTTESDATAQKQE